MTIHNGNKTIEKQWTPTKEHDIHNFPVGDRVDRKLLPVPGLPHHDRHLSQSTLSQEKSVRKHYKYEVQ